MKKITFILLIYFIALLSCQSKGNLEGTWIGEYSESFDEDFTIVNQNILSFKNNKCYWKSSINNYGIEIRESNTMLFSNKIVFNLLDSGGMSYEIQYEIEKVEGDSLVVKSISNGSFSAVYRKLPDTLKHDQNIELTNKTFLWSNKLLKDTIHFESDSTLVFVSVKDPRYSRFSWERIKYNGFDFLFIDTFIPILITNQNERTISLRTFNRAHPYDLSLTELE